MVVIPRALPQRFLHSPKPLNLLRELLSSETISWALQNSYAYDDFKAYFARHGADDVEEAINGSVNRLPTMFSAIEPNDPKTLRLLIEYGGDPNVRGGPSDVPLLALAVVQAEIYSIDTTEIVKTLLAFGADPMVIPKRCGKPT